MCQWWVAVAVTSVKKMREPKHRMQHRRYRFGLGAGRSACARPIFVNMFWSWIRKVCKSQSLCLACVCFVFVCARLHLALVSICHGSHRGHAAQPPSCLHDLFHHMFFVCHSSYTLGREPKAEPKGENLSEARLLWGRLGGSAFWPRVAHPACPVVGDCAHRSSMSSVCSTMSSSRSSFRSSASSGSFWRTGCLELPCMPRPKRSFPRDPCALDIGSSGLGPCPKGIVPAGGCCLCCLVEVVSMHDGEGCPVHRGGGRCLNLLARRATTTALTHPTDSFNPHRFSYAVAPELGARGWTCRARKGGGLYLTSGPHPSAQTLPEDPKTQALP